MWVHLGCTWTLATMEWHIKCIYAIIDSFNPYNIYLSTLHYVLQLIQLYCCWWKFLPRKAFIPCREKLGKVTLTTLTQIFLFRHWYRRSGSPPPRHFVSNLYSHWRLLLVSTTNFVSEILQHKGTIATGFLQRTFGYQRVLGYIVLPFTYNSTGAAQNKVQEKLILPRGKKKDFSWKDTYNFTILHLYWNFVKYRFESINIRRNNITRM